ncbi:MAG: penicillin-binding protein 2 [Candidatus Omnitrophota bacterium]|nr:penicillin-binding protein 2 [Candidatus Omnitrophota bacterium]
MSLDREKSLAVPIRLLFIALALALVYTQVIRCAHYSRLSKDNAIRIIPIDGPRGAIFDRNGVGIVSDRISFNVALIYQELKNREKLIRLLVNTLGIERKDVENAIDKAASRPYAPVTIVEDIDRDKAFILEEESFDSRGLVIQTRSIRDYLYKNVGAHLLGYLGEISEAELEKMKEYGCRAKDLIGRAGVEKYYDDYLSGVDGGIQIQVDNRGRVVRTLGAKEPVNGKDLRLTIDIDLQSACDKALEDKRGAIIAMDPNTGEVLALSSSPGFDPNVFVRPEGSSERMKLVRDKRMYPLLNRAISGVYQPGSVFKIVVAMAALDTGRIGRQTRFNCPGFFTLGTGKFACWKEGGHNSQNVVDALMNSCNVFFYNAGRTLGIDNIELGAKIFGFGKATGIDLPGEAKGVVPGRSWKRSVKKDGWYEGDTINLAIGQGYILVTPIQILEMISIVANNGKAVKPYVVKRIDTSDVSPAPRHDLNFNKNAMKAVRDGLYKVVNAENGTGKRAMLEGVAICGKTGTAENPGGRTHAWFSGFAPFDPSTKAQGQSRALRQAQDASMKGAELSRSTNEVRRGIDNARVSLVVLLEHGGKGGLEPSEIAKEIFAVAKNKGYL